jgi:putative ABC transport system permease protein
MRWRYILSISWKSLMDSKIRSVLTIMGVIIGVSAVTFLIALGYGFEKMTTSQVSTKDALRTIDVSLDDSELVAISPENIATFKAIEGVESVESAVNLAGKVVYKNVRSDIVVNGYSKKFFEMSNLRLLRGEVYEDETAEGQVLVSTALLTNLNIDVNDFASAVISLEIQASRSLSPSLKDGEKRLIENLKVVGVIDEGESPFAILSYERIKADVLVTNYNVTKIVTVSEEAVPGIREELGKAGFTPSYVGDVIAQINSFFTIFRYVIAGFGVIGMLVAVLGMFNTLTVSLLERTREIGVLKSNGATSQDIWRMFLTEAMVISTVGGLIGLAMGAIIGETINFFFNVYANRNGALPVDFFYVPFIFVMGMVLFVLLMGIGTGYYPSKRASRIRVLDALKYE